MYPIAITTFGLAGNTYFQSNQTNNQITELKDELEGDIEDLKHEIGILNTRQLNMERYV